jgi:hypothetical protein
MAEPFKFDSLNTNYVNLAALIRHLREKKFEGRLHVELDQYEGDIFLYGPDSPSAWEIDRTTGREEQGDAAMQRLLVRAREPGGVIKVFQNIEEKTAEPAVPITSTVHVEADKLPSGKESEPDLSSLIAGAGDLIAAVERVADSLGLGFSASFHSARVDLGDDYPFIDPFSGGLEYEGGSIRVEPVPSRSVFVSGINGVLRRTVDALARGTDETRFRELVATELAVTARRVNTLGEFAHYLDRIAGTRVA